MLPIDKSNGQFHIKDPNVTLCPVEQCLSVLYLVTYLGLQVAERLECAVV